MALRETDPMIVLRRFVDQCGGQKAASVKLGCSPQFVGQIYHGHKRVPDAMLEKLGLRRPVVTSS